MATAEERLKIIVEAQDKASATMKGVARQADSLNDSVLSLSRMATFTFAGYGVMQLGRLGVELANVAGTAQAVRDRFEAMANTRADVALERLRTAARGGVDDMTLLAETASLMQMNLANSTAEAAKLIEIATKLGDPRYSAGALLENLKFMLANQSIRRLDTFGISAGRVQTRINELTSATAGLSREAAFMQAFMEEAEVAMGRLGDQGGGLQENLRAINAEMTNLKANYAELTFGGGGTTGVAGGAAGLLRGVNEVVSDMSRGRDIMATFRQEAVATGQGLDPLIIAVMGVDGAVKTAMPNVGGLGGALTAVAGIIPGVKNEEEALLWVLGKVNPELAEQVAVLYGLGKAANNAEKGIKGLSLAEAELAAVRVDAVLLGRNRAMEITPTEYGGLTSASPAEVRKYIDARERAAMANRNLAEQIDYLREKQRGLNRASAEYWNVEAEILQLQQQRTGATASRLSDEWGELRSFAETLLQPTRVTDLDMARTRLGTYTDQWDEHIRRIRSAATDADSAWKHLIPADVLAKGTDAVKVWAAEAEQAFYSGQMPEAVDWGAFRQSAEKAIAQEAAREALVNRAMLEVADLGLGRGDVAGLLGVADTSAEAADTASQLASGMKSVDVGKEFTDGFNAQFRAQETRYIEMGALSVSWIATGVRNATNAGAADTLVSYLYNAILPKMQEALIGRP